MRLRRRLLDRRWRGRSHRRAACALVQGGWWTGGRRAWSAADPAMWSIAESCDHVREVLFGMRFMLDVAVVDPGTDLGPAPKPRFDPVSRAVDVTEALAGISHGAGELVSPDGAGPAGLDVDGDGRRHGERPSLERPARGPRCDPSPR